MLHVSMFIVHASTFVAWFGNGSIGESFQMFGHGITLWMQF